MTDNVYPKKGTHKRSDITDWLFWTVSLWSWRFKAFCKSQCKNIILYVLLKCSVTCESILPVWLYLSSRLSRIPSLHVISFFKGEIPHPLFSFFCESLPHYPNVTTRSSLTKLTSDKMTSLCDHFLEGQHHWTVLLKHFFSLQLSWLTPKQEWGWDFFCDGHCGSWGFLVWRQVLLPCSAWLSHCLWNLHVRIKTIPFSKKWFY